MTRPRHAPELAPTRPSVWQWLLRRVWYLHAPTQLMLNATPAQALAALQTAAKPSVERLHLRNVFADGRRYFLQFEPPNGFTLRTTSKVSWHPRRRTASVSVMHGRFVVLGDTLTRLELSSHIVFFYLLDVFLLPTFLLTLIITMPWGAPVIVALTLALYGLSWAWHHSSAMLEAQEMLFFVDKALAEFIPPPPEPLGEGAQVVVDVLPDFARAWQKVHEQDKNA